MSSSSLTTSGIAPEANPTPLDQLDFYVSELTKAASENKFGLKSVGNVTSTGSSTLAKPGATVEVELLEGKSIKVKLTVSGYKASLAASRRIIVLQYYGWI